MDSSESKRMQTTVIDAVGSRFAGAGVFPAAHHTRIVEQQFARRLPVGREQQRIAAIPIECPDHFSEIEIRSYVGIVEQHRFIACQRQGFQQAAAGVEQLIAFVAYSDVDTEIVVGGKEIAYHL